MRSLVQLGKMIVIIQNPASRMLCTMDCGRSEALCAERSDKEERMELMPRPVPDRREIIRYLGYRGDTPGREVLEEIEYCVRELEKAAAPRFIYERFDLERARGEDGEEVLLMAGLSIRSRDLAKNLSGCRGAYMMAATIGPGPDLLVRRASVTKMSRAVIYQAAGAAMIENWCDLIGERIRREAAKEGLFTRPRFSPGYGDLPLEMQRDLVRILNMPKEIGVSLTDTLLMTPSKSVTALIGVSETAKDCGDRRCEACGSRADCPYEAP